MKRKYILPSTIIFILLTILFTNAVSAALYTAAADDLKSLGVFFGTDSGYELDREPTRAEAAVMLVRLLGKEAEAKEKNFTHPFTDVPKWADNYIGWLQKNNLTNGIGDNKFGSSDLCNANMFCVFVLRALGYMETAGDFTYEKAVDFAVKLGLIDNNVESQIGYNKILLAGSFRFVRDHCVSIMHHALNTKIKGREITLIEKIIADTSVDKKAMENFMAKNDLLEELSELIDMNKNKPIFLERITNGVKTSMSVIDSTSALINVFGTDVYYKDGYEYVDFAGKKTKKKSKSDFNSFDNINIIFDDMINNYMNSDMVNKVEKTIDDKEIVYETTSIRTMVWNENVISSVIVTYVFTPQGELCSINNRIMENGEIIEGTHDSITISIGDGVKIDFPDFSDYFDAE